MRVAGRFNVRFALLQMGEPFVSEGLAHFPHFLQDLFERSRRVGPVEPHSAGSVLDAVGLVERIQAGRYAGEDGGTLLSKFFTSFFRL